MSPIWLPVAGVGVIVGVQLWTIIIERRREVER